MPDEKDLRNISVNGNDLLGCLAREESNEYFKEEGKGKKLYHKARVTYKSKAGKCSKIRQWTPKEIQMYEQLKECKTAAEMILLLLKTEDEVSVWSAKELLKDHPKKPGARGLALALQEIYKKMSGILRKRFVNRHAFYSFEREEYKDIDLKNLFSFYHGKLIWDEIKPVSNIKDFDTDKLFTKAGSLDQRIKELEECNAGLEHRLHTMEKVSKIFLNKELPSGQRLDVHFYLHFGKED
jgi:hypothetical protein